MPYNRDEQRVRLAAGRRGLKVLMARLATTRRGGRNYCLRALWDASQFVGELPDGRLGYIRVPPADRERIAIWRSLGEVERALANCAEPPARAWGQACNTEHRFANVRHTAKTGGYRGVKEAREDRGGVEFTL